MIEGIPFIHLWILQEKVDFFMFYQLKKIKFNFLQKEKKKKKKNPNISRSYQTKGKFLPILPFFSCLLRKPLFSVWGIDVSFITAELYCFNCLSKISNTEKKMLVQKFSIITEKQAFIECIK